MECSHCKYPNTRVWKTHRLTPEVVTRRRECPRCSLRFTTVEHRKEKKRSNDEAFPMPGDRYS